MITNARSHGSAVYFDATAPPRAAKAMAALSGASGGHQRDVSDRRGISGGSSSTY